MLKYCSCTYTCDRCEKDTTHILITQGSAALREHPLASPPTKADIMPRSM